MTEAECEGDVLKPIHCSVGVRKSGNLAVLSEQRDRYGEKFIPMCVGEIATRPTYHQQVLQPRTLVTQQTKGLDSISTMRLQLAMAVNPRPHSLQASLLPSLSALRFHSSKAPETRRTLVLKPSNPSSILSWFDMTFFILSSNSCWFSIANLIASCTTQSRPCRVSGLSAREGWGSNACAIENEGRAVSVLVLLAAVAELARRRRYR